MFPVYLQCPANLVPDKVAVRWTATLTHTGDNLGFAATGRIVRLPGSSFVRIKDGKITDGWNQLDFTVVLQNLQSSSPTA
jgi:predicted ester cyclase